MAIIIAWDVRNVKKGLAIRGNFYYDERKEITVHVVLNVCSKGCKKV